ncbi:FAD-binding oxidoreductase [Polyangium jinanense]|uniref:FAD-binding oxidoreductase n=1 Tax=Polyangium jinanense TaxID=2829994 RepID=A0A9X3X2W6_9BACT|nr:FAD-binding protein [Polyangium jinanense]MDC3952822.1 FAD-binding oxidoreductase [Polyangium jinanense]MDC3980441.1 FAD-binding oxidoreductase [Polyangium jinanense]
MNLEAALGQALPNLTVSASPVDRIAYARDLWPRHHLAVSDGRIADHRPGVVVWPNNTEDVASVVRFCAKEGIPLVPFGAGSGVCGGVLPDERTVVLDLKRMDRVRRLDAEAGVLDVEAGALGIRLEEDLNAAGHTLGHFPSSILCSTVGGWVAARSAGQCSGLYGKIEDMVASLECVVGEGEIVRFDRRLHGPDATPLIIGSEGVLGVVTSARLRLHPAPAARAFGAFSFPTVEAGWEAMRQMFQSGIRPAVARLYDVFDSFIARLGSVRRRKHAGPKKTLEERGEGAGFGAAVLRRILRRPGVLNRIVDAAPSDWLGGATLILVFEGQAAQSEADLVRARQIALSSGARDLGEGPARHWLSHRYSVSYRQSPVFMAGAFSDTMEVAAPWSRLGELYRSVREALGKNVFVMAHLSHAYPDGCSIYFTFAGSAPTPAAMESVYDWTWRTALDAAIGAGGTLSHHHGVGRSKAPRLGAELGRGIDVVHALRHVLDPRGIMNPGNLLPRDPPERRPVPPPPQSPTLDRASLLVHASGEATLAEVETFLSRSGLTLGLGSGAPDLAGTTVDAWLARGAPGAPDPWLDPADHLVAGFTARLRSGAEFEVRPSPRRAVGPDLFALFFGMNGRAGVIRSAHLRAHSKDPLTRPRPLEARLERNPPLGATEAAWIDRMAGAASRVD